MDVDEVFRALADPTRRSLLDGLLRWMARPYGVAPRCADDPLRGHEAPGILEDAGLVVPRRRGRDKHHYLNPVPIQLIHDRWVSRYTEPWASGLFGPQARHRGATHGEGVQDLEIKTTPERLWQAITDPAIRAHYQFGNHVSSDLAPNGGAGR